MKRFLILFVLIGTFMELKGEDPMKNAKEEAKREAKQQLFQAQEMLSNKEIGFSQQDVLPEEDKGKTFDPKSAENDCKNASSIAETSELQGFLGRTKKQEHLENEEAFLVESHHIIQNPLSQADITSLETTFISEEEKIQTCQENGTYQVAFSQKLFVQATPEIKQDVKHCQGHTKSKTYANEKKAKHHLSEKKDELKENQDLLTYEVHRDGTTVTSFWTHKDSVSYCDHYSVESKVVQEGKEEDFWETDQPEGLAIIESNPFCKLLYTQTVQGPETRAINNKAVYRDVWGRQLFFSCEPDANSKCTRLREQGGILIAKKCLDENDLGECALWEKTYDLGKRGSYQQTQAIFKNEPIWGINEDSDAAYEKNLDFGAILTTLSIFSDLESNLEDKDSDLRDKVEIFKGENLKCEKSFVEGKVFDCCKKMDGLAVHVHLANCKEEEKCLGKKRHEGKCHFIGSQKTKLGSVTEHVYCCFPTKLVRVIQEQGRKQLGLKWGKADKPKCRGLSLEELQQIDFSKIDLSEVIDDLKIDKQAYQHKLKTSIESLQSKVETQIKEEQLKLSNQSKNLGTENGKTKEQTDQD